MIILRRSLSCCAILLAVLAPSSCSGPQPEKGFSKTAAAWMLVGAATVDAQTFGSLVGKIKAAGGTPPQLEYSSPDLAEALKVAGVSREAGATLELFIKSPEFYQRSVMQELINQIEEESLQKLEHGPAWVKIGSGVGMLNRLLTELYRSRDPSSYNSEVPRKILGAPVAKQAFTYAAIVSMPADLKAALTSIENADMSTFDGYQACIRGAQVFLSLTRAAALGGTSTPLSNVLPSASAKKQNCSLSAVALARCERIEAGEAPGRVFEIASPSAIAMALEECVSCKPFPRIAVQLLPSARKLADVVDGLRKK